MRSSPLHQFIRAIKSGWGALVVWQIILHWNRGIPALNMKLWTEHSLRKQISVNAAHREAWYLSEKISSAGSALHARRCP
jgi:hypothetical protein